MSEEIIEPPFIVPPSVPRFTAPEVAAMIADPSLSLETALRQVRRFAQQRWIHPVGQRGTGITAANLFAPSAVGAAKVLSVLTDLGIEDHATMSHASLPLIAWPDDQPRLASHKGPPIIRAMTGAVKNEFWVYQLRLLRGDQTGQRNVRAWVYDADAWAGPKHEAASSEMLPRAVVTLNLLPLMLPLHRKIMAAIGAGEPVN